jgi:hypothetical protein
LAIFPDVVDTPSNLASDAAGVAAHTAPKSADAGTPAPDLAPANAGEVVETCPQVDANAPSQLIREICNRMSYPCASKSTSRANPGVAEKHTTPARARQAVAQGKGVARKKATQHRFKYSPIIVIYIIDKNKCLIRCLITSINGQLQLILYRIYLIVEIKDALTMIGNHILDLNPTRNKNFGYVAPAKL